MSSFTITAKHKKSGAIYKVWCLDDHFGRHVYGYVPQGVEIDEALKEKEFYDQYEPVELEP